MIQGAYVTSHTLSNGAECGGYVIFQPKQGNRVAHFLAQFWLKEQDRSVWVGHAPSWLGP